MKWAARGFNPQSLSQLLAGQLIPISVAKSQSCWNGLSEEKEVRIRDKNPFKTSGTTELLGGGSLTGPVWFVPAPEVVSTASPKAALA